MDSMKRLLFFLFVIVIAGCSDRDSHRDPDWLAMNYSDIEQAAQGSTVRFAMRAAPHAGSWVDRYVIPTMKREHDIRVVRVPMSPDAFVRKVLDEKDAGNQSGTIDMIWVNGENFKTLMHNEALFGPYAAKLPNYIKFVNRELAAVDFGFPNNGYETPLGKAQFVFEYDSARLPEPPRSYEALRRWVRDNPGKFTYRMPPDYVGSAFVRQVFYSVSGGSEQFFRGYDRDLYERFAPRAWEYLNEIEPFLWEEGKKYPSGHAEMEELFTSGEVLINMSYNPLRARSRILDGRYPETVRSYVMREGSLFNLHFTAIPFNARNKAGAMVLANFLMSPAAQYSKLDPVNWGDYPAIDVGRLPESIREKFASVHLGTSVVSPHELAVVAVPEIPAEYVTALEKGWEENVFQ